ncbi:ribosome biogenesis GTPase YlqF [Francisella philomiragia]|uniref:Ribosome biogenesis GTPase A n=1 Tax=Francisella philomiragia TaxID=28110 RepID=A0AAW3D9F6_9GAMM|nr:ribosome biogenesis GTPase YlqF [Francisella philomiragia]KFJ41919.1 ribosome biogenesis GTP-binding protein YlqF [Francisella philomiragia]MBK2025937.1 ribosome biogenesis GTPase YlqF [Francisella philomiragia]MBK2093457.1 ribosome biogenesis GTPase YlqF [Francisella philomiragia]MBK2106552.1 ribosome biogenesis GTPase YlqF [Francisella philomiragia]MBK2254241.1 ribosome biogenesis GTPase YlqF [Francisella philomiragia]
MLHWFPGHMHKATKEFRKKMPSTDIAIEIVDARIPDSSSNHVLEDIVGDKPIIRILSKSDLADPQITKQWLDFYKGSAIAVNTLQDKNIVKRILDLAQKKCPSRGTVLKPTRAIIFGLPNVGKSTMINKLAGRKVAKTGNEPAVTKLQQRIDISKNFMIFDTPGIMFPSPKSEVSGYRIASIGSIRDTAMDYEGTAYYLIDFLKQKNTKKFLSRYNFISEQDFLEKHPQEIIKDISATKTNYNVKQAAKNIVHDFRAGHFGKISLEDPQIIQQEKEQFIMNQLEQEDNL